MSNFMTNPAIGIPAMAAVALAFIACLFRSAALDDEHPRYFAWWGAAVALLLCSTALNAYALVVNGVGT